MTVTTSVWRWLAALTIVLGILLVITPLKTKAIIKQLSDDCYIGDDGWVVCVDPNTDERRRGTCADVQCGVGCGGGFAGVYCCAVMGDCGGGGPTPMPGGAGGGGGGGDPCWPYGCPQPPAPTATPIPPTPTPIPRIEVSGTVYNDLTGLAGYTGFGRCIDPTGRATPFKPGGGSKVAVNPDGRDGPVEGNGNYVVNQVLQTGLKTIAISGMDAGYLCTCPQTNCQYNSVSISGGNNTGWNFYVSNILAKWAQVVGGHVHGQTGAIVEVPAGNYLMIKGSFSNEPGAASKTSGSITTIPGQLSTTNWNLTDALTQTTWRYAYQRLWVRAGGPTTDPGDGFTSVPAPGIYRKTGDFSISGGGWQGLTGSRVIFVDGDVTINNKVTLAGSGDFLAVIASGNVSVNPTVGDSPMANPTSADADLVGAFLANGNFQGGSAGQTDKQLVIYGTVGADIDMNGSGRVRFQRDMGVNNRVGPGVSVIWNPFLLLNFPSQLTDAVTDWREVAP